LPPQAQGGKPSRDSLFRHTSSNDDHVELSSAAKRQKKVREAKTQGEGFASSTAKLDAGFRLEGSQQEGEAG
jgi:hypothetical protein